MRPSMLSHLFILFVFVILPSFPIAAATGFASGNATVEETCRGVIGSTSLDYSFCVGTLKADPESQGADRWKLASIAVEVAIANASSALAKAEGLPKEKLDPVTKVSLRISSYFFWEGMFALRWTREFIDLKSSGAAKEMVKAAVSWSTACEDVIDAKLGIRSPLNKENNDFSRLTILAAAIVNTLGY